MATESKIRNPQSEIFKILLIEDNPGDAALIEEMLNTANVRFDLQCVERLATGIARLGAESFDVVLLDLGLPDSQGLATLSNLVRSGAKAPVIVLTGLADDEVGTQAVIIGAQDYLIKGQIDHRLLARSIKQAIERVKLKEAVKIQTRQFETFFNNAITPLAFLDRDFNFIRVNQAYADATQRAVAEFPGHNHFEFYPSEAQAIFAEVVSSRQPFQAFARPFIYPDHPEWGVTYWNWTLVPILDDNGEVEFLAFSLVDVTAQKQAEQALQQSEAVLRALIEHSPVAMLVDVGMEMDEHIILMNQRFTELFGYTLVEVPDVRHWWPLAYPDEKCREEVRVEWLRRVEQATRDQGDIEPMEATVACKDGSSRYVRISLASTGSRNIVTFEDLTERKRSEEALKSSEEFIKDILASVDEAFVVLDREYRIITANKAYCEQSGEALENILGRHCYEISHRATQPCQEAECVCGCKQTFATGEPAVTAHIHTDAKGRQRQVEIKTYAMKDEAGEVKSVIEVISDITEKKALEAQLRQAQKMEAIGTLAGGIAHDFNNILTAIIGFGEFVMDQLPAGSRLREDQAHVVKAGMRARDLVKQILTFSRRSEQKLQPLLIQFIVKEALKLIRSSIPTSIKIREDIEVNCGAVLADPVQIHQVVMNLCTNAYQAMRETGGVMSVSLKNVTVSADTTMVTDLHPGPYVLLEVTDGGCGMSGAVQERIFEPYFTTKGTGEGTGLGMAVVHGIVTILGGAISVSSEPGQGATFKVYLPVIAKEAPDQQQLKKETVPGGDEVILLVDDEETITLLERQILVGLGYKVTAFVDSAQALQAFRENPGGFDLILTDMSMPKLSGDKLAMEIIRLRPGMPIILCSGFSETIDAEKAKALGISEYLPKPLTLADLANAVRRVLDRNKCAG